MYETVKKALVIGLFVALISLVCAVVRYVDTLDVVTAQLPVVAQNTVHAEFQATRAMISKQITAVRKDLFARVDTAEGHLNQQIKDVSKSLDRQLTDTRAAAVTEIAKVTTPAGETITEAKALIEPARNIVDHVSDNSDLLLDCDHNPDCLANRTIGTMKAIEKTSVSIQKMTDAVARETPETAAAVRSTSKDLSTITARFAKPVTWLKGVLGTAANVAGKFLGL